MLSFYVMGIFHHLLPDLQWYWMVLPVKIVSLFPTWCYLLPCCVCGLGWQTLPGLPPRHSSFSSVGVFMRISVKSNIWKDNVDSQPFIIIIETWWSLIHLKVAIWIVLFICSTKQLQTNAQNWYGLYYLSFYVVHLALYFSFPSQSCYMYLSSDTDISN